MRGESVRFAEHSGVTPVKGSAGLPAQLPGMATTVSNTANASGGIAGGNLIKTSVK